MVDMIMDSVEQIQNAELYNMTRRLAVFECLMLSRKRRWALFVIRHSSFVKNAKQQEPHSHWFISCFCF